MFFFFTKRIARFSVCMPEDWGDGYENLIIGCTVENQEIAEVCLPIFMSLPIRHRGAKLLKGDKLYRIRRPFQISQTVKAGINDRIGEDFKPV